MKKVIILLALLALSVGTFSCGGGGAGSADVADRGKSRATICCSITAFPYYRTDKCNNYSSYQGP